LSSRGTGSRAIPSGATGPGTTGPSATGPGATESGATGGVAALIAAAGAGTRLGSGPKALLRLGDSTLLELTLAAFAGFVDQIVVAAPADYVDRLGAAHPEVTVIAGGETRQRTVKRLVEAGTSELVVVHDVARPFLPAAVLRRVIAAARRHGAATAAVTIADTIVTLDPLAASTAAVHESSSGYGSVVEREALRAVQTPQAFDRELLANAHAAAAAAGTSATDDAGLVTLSGRYVELVEGSRLLFKITEPADLILAEALLPRWLANSRAQT